MVLQEKCIICGFCIGHCKEKAIITVNKKAYIIPEKCTECGLCVGKCPKRAIRPAEHFQNGDSC